MTFGKRLKELRTEHNLTQEQLGELLNLSKANISRYENNVHEPSFSTLEFLCKYFGVSINYILGKSDIKEENINYDNKLNGDELNTIVKFFSEPENKGYLEIDILAKKSGITSDMLLAFVKGFLSNNK